MAKVKVLGDMIQIKSEITKSEMERVKAFAPDALKLFDAEGNEIFGVGFGNASFSKYGVCFCSEAADGKVFMTTNNPVTDHSDAEKEREEITKVFAQLIAKLEVVEANIQGAREQLESIEASVQDAIEFAD